MRGFYWLLEVMRGGSFVYRSKAEFSKSVKQRIGRSPNKQDRHWNTIPHGDARHPAIGFAIRWKLIKHVDIRCAGRFPQLGWANLMGRKQPISAVLDSADLYDEPGTRAMQSHFAIERNPTLRNESKLYWRTKMNGAIRCIACGFSFKKKYGIHGDDFIEMHHERPLAGPTKSTKKKVTELKPVCSNCHRMIHRHPRASLSMRKLNTLLGESQ